MASAMLPAPMNPTVCDAKIDTHTVYHANDRRAQATAFQPMLKSSFSCAAFEPSVKRESV